MQVATIVPTPYLQQTENDEYLMCLYQEVKNQITYAEFFRQQSIQGKFVIMDNGAAEGENPSWKELLEIYPLVNPSEVVLPDVIYNKEETIRQTREAFLEFESAKLRDKIPGLRYMLVPQGNTFREWRECMQEFVRQCPVTIGVSKFVTPKFAEEMGPGTNVRLECVDAIVSYCGGVEKMKRMGVQIHLLGCWNNPKEIGDIARKYGSAVRGTDSAIAYVYTRNGIEYSPEISRPDNNHIDFKEGDAIDLELFEQNKSLWINYCKGNLEVI